MKGLYHFMECSPEWFSGIETKEDLHAKISGSISRHNVWVRFVGMPSEEAVKSVCEYFGVHELTAEDILNTDHQPKYDIEQNYTQTVVKIMDTVAESDNALQLSILTGEDFVLSFEQKRSSFIDLYYKKIEHSKVKAGARKVSFDILDSVVDQYMECAYTYQDKLDILVEGILESTDEYDLKMLFGLKRELYSYRRVVRPILEISEKIAKYSNVHSSEESIFVRDLVDHAYRVAGLADSMVESCNNMQADILTQLQYRLSKTMNIMTAAAFIFSPLMVITGIYGMNFDHMPELGYKYAYPIVLLLMFVVAFGLVMFFRYRNYIDNK